MDMLVVIGLLIVVGFYLVFSKSDAKIKGKEGEKIVKNLLNKLNRKHYSIFNDVTFSINDKISQIDHIVVSNYGIFVIETKNYKGVISGRENDHNWMQVIGKYKNQFYNPIRQNQGHIYALKYVLKGLQEVEYESLIVFTNRSSLKVKTSTSVIYPNKLLKNIRLKKEAIISEELKLKVIERINEDNLTRRKIRVKLKKAS